MSEREILSALARLVDAEQHGTGRRPAGDILERSVRKKNQCGGNSAKLTTSLGVPNVGSGVQFQLREIPPDVYTVHVSVLDLPPYVPFATGPSIFVSTLVTVVFGANGQQTVRRASVGQGVSLSGQCDYVNVMVTDNTPGFPRIIPPPVLPPPFQYQVSITVAPGLRADTFGPPTLDPYDALGFLITPSAYALGPGADTGAIVVPQNVGVISTQVTIASVTGAPIPEGSVVVQQVATGNNVIAAYDPRDTPGWVPLRSGAQALIILNGSTVPIQASVVFGIDA